MQEDPFIDAAYRRYLVSIAPETTHAGYFAQDKKGKAVDASERNKEGKAQQAAAYHLIMCDKERLLSFERTRSLYLFSLGSQGRVGQPQRLSNLHAQAE